MLTVFTPTYNRAYILPRLYESLLKQTDRNFEWVIVNDGSTDNTRELVKEWINENKFTIRYYEQENQGKPMAHNMGVEMSSGEIFTCVDSDDFLTDNAIEIINRKWNECKKEKKCIGIVGTRIKLDGQPVGSGIIPGVQNSTLYDLYNKHKYTGDTILVYKTEILKKYKFPKIEGEKFIPETYLYNQLDAEGELATIKDGVYVCEYLNDGYTNNSVKLINNNPKGYILAAEQELTIAKKIEERLNKSKIKLIEIQRSKGYSTRKSISNSKIKKVVDLIRNYDKDVIIMVDNCYCEFVDKVSPIEMGADIIVGSLIKNLGGGIAPNGAYIAGKKRLVDLAGERLTLPGEGREVGPTLGINKQILEGLFFSPSVVASALKTAVLASKVLEELGYKVEPRYNDERVDIVQNIIFNDRDMMIKYCQGIQKNSPIDSNSLCIPSYMPGYDDDVIMASGSFTQGSSIELSCDGPLRSPYIAYQQGSLTYEYGRYAIINSIKNMLDENKNE